MKLIRRACFPVIIFFVILLGNNFTLSQETANKTRGTVTDIDGNEHPTVVIGEQEWMAENLRTTRYANGDSISYYKRNDTIDFYGTTGYYTIYPHHNVYKIDSEKEMSGVYGNLYDWYAVNDNRGLCPDGWKVPTDADWEQLTDYLVKNYEDITPTNVGNALKSRRQIDSPLEGDFSTSRHPRWTNHHNHYGTNDFGFSALPTGIYVIDSTFGTLGINGHWWTATEDLPIDACLRVIYYDYGGVDRFCFYKFAHLPVRCIKDN